MMIYIDKALGYAAHLSLVESTYIFGVMLHNIEVAI